MNDYLVEVNSDPLRMFHRFLLENLLNGKFPVAGWSFTDYGATYYIESVLSEEAKKDVFKELLILRPYCKTLSLTNVEDGVFVNFHAREVEENGDR